MVKIGAKVKKDQVLAIKEDIDFPLLSPVNGVIKDIAECIYLDGRRVKGLVIEKKGKDPVLKEAKEIDNYSKEEFIETLRKYGVSGMGGGDFPTFLKYKPLLSTLIINAVECEPYITSDYVLGKLKYEEIIETINAIIKINDIRVCFIAINEKHTDLINLYNTYTYNYPKINIVSTKDYYPMGWEKTLIKEILGIDYNKIPQEKGIVVNNLATIYSMYEALKFNTSTDKRIISISGDRIIEPINALGRIGSDMKKLVSNLELVPDDTIKFVAGGPMMGRAIPTSDLIATKSLNCVLFIDDYEEKIVHPCFRCGRCIDVCPVDIAPVLIKDSIRKTEELKKLNPEKCIECGLCSFICPSNIDVRSFVKKAKRSV